MNQIPFTPALRQHLLIGLLQGLWVYLFLVIIGPFDTYELSFEWRARLMFGYWIIFTLSYWFVIPWQSRWYVNWKGWGWPQETIMVSIVFLVAFIPIYLYYKSDIVQGEFPFSAFLGKVYLPASLILLPMMIAVRRFIMRNESVLIDFPIAAERILLKGSYQKDLLQIQWNDLVCIKSAGNYVEVYFLQENHLEKKLLRTSLQKIQEDFPRMLRVHRSNLINPDHFIAWKDRRHLTLTQIEVPVSDNYRNRIEEHFLVRP